MAIKPILFNTEMVKAILEGRKTQTRRVVKNQDGIHPRRNNISFYGWDDGHGYQMMPPCKENDILWVRETWDNVPFSPGGHFRFIGRYYYKADGDLRPDSCRGNWHPSIHMPKDAARIFLRVKAVKIERLRHISFDDCKHEGIWDDYKTTSQVYHDSLARAAYPNCFAELWNSTIKPADRDRYSWEANPWVWVIEFERCERPDGWH